MKKEIIEKLKGIKHKKLVIAIVIILLLFILIFPRLGEWLVKEDEITQSDIIVVLMGSVPDRTLEAVDIYQEGYSDKILMINSHMVGYDDLLERGVEIPGDAQLAHMAANSLGVPEEDLLILPAQTKSTQDEAIVLRDYLRENEDIDSMILVTSKYHSSRSKKIFEKALEGMDRDITVISRPSEYDNFNEEQWWKDREDFKRVVMEYVKFINYYAREQFQL